VFNAIGDDINMLAIFSCVRTYKNEFSTISSDFPREPSAAGLAAATDAGQGRTAAENNGSRDDANSRSVVSEEQSNANVTSNAPIISRFRMKDWIHDDDFRPATCDGPCGRRFSNYDHLRMCRQDMSERCSDCFALPDGQAWVSPLYHVTGKCSPLHDFFQFPPVTTRFRYGEILVDGKAMGIGEWVVGIRKLFDIE
jgi:hypothetical protein